MSAMFAALLVGAFAMPHQRRTSRASPLSGTPQPTAAPAARVEEVPRAGSQDSSEESCVRNAHYDEKLRFCVPDPTPTPTPLPSKTIEPGASPRLGPPSPVPSATAKASPTKSPGTSSSPPTEKP
jgi:hypothetical protein